MADMTPTEKDAMALATLAACEAYIDTTDSFHDRPGEGSPVAEHRKARAHLASRIAELVADNENLCNRLIDERHDREKIIRRYAEQLQHEVQHQRAINEQLTKHLISGAAFLPPAPMIIAADAAALLDRAARAEAELAAVRANAERYLHLREANNADPTPFIAQRYEHGIMQWTGEEADAAIDAARGGE